MLLQPVSWKIKLEMVIGMENEFLIGIKKLLTSLFEFSNEKRPTTIVS